MSTQFRRINFEGGEYESRDHLRSLLQGVKASLRLICADKVSIRVTCHGSNKRRLKGARGFIKCFHHEDAAQFMQAVQRQHQRFQVETSFFPADFVTVPARTLHPRYASSLREDQASKNLYSSLKNSCEK